MSQLSRASSSCRRIHCKYFFRNEFQPRLIPSWNRRSHISSRTGTQLLKSRFDFQVVLSTHISTRRSLFSSNVTDDTSTNCIGDSRNTKPAALRNKKLAGVIREGIANLNQSAAAILNNTHTAKSIFTSPEEIHGPDARQLSEEHRIFTIAQECLEDMCTKNPSFGLMAGEEPILLLGIKVKPSYSHADIYWSLPYRLLTSPQLNEQQKEFLKEKMDERLQGASGRALRCRINAVLSSYYPPKIRFKAAPPLLVHQVVHDLDEE